MVKATSDYGDYTPRRNRCRAKNCHCGIGPDKRYCNRHAYIWTKARGQVQRLIALARRKHDIEVEEMISAWCRENEIE